MKFKLSLIVACFIPTLSFAAGALMQLEVPAIAQPVISERSNTDILGPKFNSLTVDESATAETPKEGVGEHAFKYVTGQEASKAAPRATYGGNMGSAQGQPTPSLGTGFK